MATEAQLIAGLQAADKAGNTDDARVFAQALVALRAQNAAAPATPQSNPQGPAPSLWETPLQALGNLPSSAASAAEGLYSAVRHPIDTAKTIGQLAFGEGEHLANQVMGGSEGVAPTATLQNLPQWQQDAYRIAGAENKNLADRYGGWDNAKRTLATDPVGALMDASVLFGGVEGATGRLPGVAGKVGETAGDISRAINPVNVAAKGVGTVAKAAAPVLQAAAKAPSIEELKNAARAAYQMAHNSGVTVKSSAMADMVQALTDDLAKKGFDPQLHPGAARALQRLQDAATNGNDVSLQDLDTLRKVAGSAANSSATNPSNKFMARVIQDHIDDFVNNLGADQVSGATDPAAIDALNNARDYWNRASKAEIIQRAFDKAANRPDTQNLATALRTQFRNIANNQRAFGRFSPEEQKAIQLVVRGGPAEKAFRLVGLLAPNSLTGMGRMTIGSMAGGALGAAGGPPGIAGGAAVAPAIGQTADWLARGMTSRNARLASELVRGDPLPGATATPTRLSIMLNGLGQGANALSDTRAAKLAPLLYEASAPRFVVDEYGNVQLMPQKPVPLSIGFGPPIQNTNQPIQIGP